jgi:DNA-binding MarR family transcriptional regulator
MHKKEKKFKDVMAQFMKAMHRFKKLEETPMDYGSGDILYRSEIHAIEAIGNNHGSNLTELAAGLEITKGTLSPLISKLVKKGLVLKKKGDRNDKEILLELTKKGRTAFEGHQSFHREMYLDFTKIYQDVSLEELDAFECLLVKFKNSIDQYCDKKSTGNSGFETKPRFSF